MDGPAIAGDADFERVRALFDGALELPAQERDALVRREAGDDAALAERVLALLQDDAARDTDALRDAMTARGGGSAGGGGERVQSSATGELFDKLKTAPKLDGQRFVLEGELGQGGMGVVMRIHDRFLNRRLAMKVLLERRAPRDEDEQRLAHQLLGRFLEEAQVTSQLDHPGVVPVHELGLDEAGKVWFTMRMVKGRTASEVFADCYAKKGEWDMVRGLEVVLKVCDTMAYAHDKGVLHRDLKPSNVMVGRFGEVYVMDWGLAKVLGQADRHDLRIRKDGTSDSAIESARKRDADSDTPNSVVSMDGQQLGTPSYMSPEQARSEDVDARADVYSIGAMLYELVTGRAPYTAPGVRKHAYYILKEVVERPPQRIESLQRGVSAELVAIIERAMSRGREQRYRDVLALAADVRAFVSHRAVQAYRTGPIVELKLWVRRNKALAATMAAAVLLLVAGVATSSVFAAQLESRVRQFDQLALVVDYEQLIEEEKTLGPGYPDQADAITDWLHRAQSLLRQRSELTLLVAASEGAGGGAAQVTSKFLGKSLGELLEKLPKLDALVPEVERRSHWAHALVEITLRHPNAKFSWDDAHKAISASPKYAGQDIPLRDRDIWGLAPIGENPQSRLWEFYDLRSAWDGVGDPTQLARQEIPEHDPDGRIDVTADSGIVWILIPGGTLPPAMPAHYADARRRRDVHLAPFFISKYELTRSQWNRLDRIASHEARVGDSVDPLGPRRAPPGRIGASSPELDPILPVAQLTWHSATTCFHHYGMSLPSELQWEYAARGGTSTDWWTGDSKESLRQAECILVANDPMPVGTWEPNPFGLFDACGNVWEWCCDAWGPYGTEVAGTGRRPQAPSPNTTMVFRGGDFGFGEGGAQTRARGDLHPADSLWAIGVRPTRPSSR